MSKLTLTPKETTALLGLVNEAEGPPTVKVVLQRDRHFLRVQIGSDEYFIWPDGKVN